MILEPFQARFLAAATAKGVHLASLSLPRGNGKSRLAAFLVERILNPADPLFRPGTESVLCAASIEQARIVYRFAHAELEPTGQYRFIDSATRAAILHKATNTRLRVLGSNGKTAFGLVNCPWVICDEPGSWEVTGGALLHDAIETAKGKPGSPLRSLYIGTIAPSPGGRCFSNNRLWLSSTQKTLFLACRTLSAFKHLASLLGVTPSRSIGEYAAQKTAMGLKGKNQAAFGLS